MSVEFIGDVEKPKRVKFDKKIELVFRDEFPKKNPNQSASSNRLTGYVIDRISAIVAGITTLSHVRESSSLLRPESTNFNEIDQLFDGNQFNIDECDSRLEQAQWFYDLLLRCTRNEIVVKQPIPFGEIEIGS
ncbi:hypothetical protein ECANGB1_1592 [Enterospora canceri]|uniref:Uncharacterized protein n=1 Tax=Enterospora canceri TaxID=1081671 RepID=A0A1Y1S5Q1_9MICR|nr:hypothetical protein ECANGB1_1592 [Enterospora canceri]